MIAPQDPLAWGLVAVVAAVLARLVIAVVAPLVAVDAAGRPVPPPAGFGRAFQVASVLGALALWWWEVVARGQLPGGGPPAVDAGPLVVRYAAHLILFSLLAAASWVDLRERIIPDVITMPGVLAGLNHLLLQKEQAQRSSSPSSRRLGPLSSPRNSSKSFASRKFLYTDAKRT